MELGALSPNTFVVVNKFRLWWPAADRPQFVKLFSQVFVKYALAGKVSFLSHVCCSELAKRKLSRTYIIDSTRVAVCYLAAPDSCRLLTCFFSGASGPKHSGFAL
jgi:hypothetical protein